MRRCRPGTFALSMLSAFTLITAVITAPMAAQSPSLHPVDAFPLRSDGPVLRQAVASGAPFTVAGPQGVFVGQQQGLMEAWLLPVKLLSHLTIEAEVEGYPVPLDLNSMAREIEVRPDRTTITYSHIAVTVRQIMFAPQAAEPGTGAVVLFQVDAVHPVTLTLRFTPEMREMWPKPSSGVPSPEWVATPANGSGYYLLHTDYPKFTGAIALPGATSGIMAPYQERPQVHPLELHLRIDPAKDRNRFFPLLLAVGRTLDTAANSTLAAKLQQLNDNLPALYAAHASRCREQEQSLTSIVTPDAALNDDLTWAEVSIGQLRAKAPDGELGLVAGYYASGDSARPGFGWYFGRDTLTTLTAVNSYGDFALSRTALEFLMKRQRADGKVMHEYSQTAGEIDWSSFPYEYAAADATPLFLTSMLDYVRSSGDLDFLRTHRAAVESAWHFETTHDADGDGIYDNAQGTGWVESWPPGMPQQEIYLALMDQQGSVAMAQLARLLGDGATSTTAQQRAKTLHAMIEREYYQPASQTYAFSRNATQPNNLLDSTSTIFPAIAWWTSTNSIGPAGAHPLDHPDASLRAWASHDFDTDWGTRDVSERAPLYDPISYHQGSVWPLFTGWAAMAQYRSDHTLAGYQATMQNADLTHAQDIGAVTELLSGGFFEPFGRSTSHQLWSSAMVATPVLRGLFGIDVDALAHTLTLTPHLPADWPSADVHQLHIGNSVIDLHYRREATTLLVTMHSVSGPPVKLKGATSSTLRLPLSDVEVSIAHGLPLRGSRTSQMKVIEEKHEAHSLSLTLDGVAGTESVLRVQRNHANLRIAVEGATLTGDDLHVQFPAGSGYIAQTVTLRW